MTNAEPGRQPLLEFQDLWTQDVLAMVKNSVNAGIDGVLQVAVLRL